MCVSVCLSTSIVLVLKYMGTTCCETHLFADILVCFLYLYVCALFCMYV